MYGIQNGARGAIVRNAYTRTYRIHVCDGIGSIAVKLLWYGNQYLSITADGLLCVCVSVWKYACMCGCCVLRGCMLWVLNVACNPTTGAGVLLCSRENACRLFNRTEKKEHHNGIDHTRSICTHTVPTHIHTYGCMCDMWHYIASCTRWSGFACKMPERFTSRCCPDYWGAYASRFKIHCCALI